MWKIASCIAEFTVMYQFAKGKRYFKSIREGERKKDFVIQVSFYTITASFWIIAINK